MEQPAGSRPADRARITTLPTDALTPEATSAIRDLLWQAFGDGEDAIREEDWQHALGGVHFLLDLDGEMVGHAAVVERELEICGRPVRTGYVEAVATAVAFQGRGLGSQLMREVNADIRDRFELGALGTGRQGFYERLDWVTWKGPTSVRTAEGLRPTPEEDGYILVLQTPTSPELDLTAPITCHWRPGDVW
jgi:aminoglycoside 2'-N-acetyltransferase I